MWSDELHQRLRNEIPRNMLRRDGSVKQFYMAEQASINHTFAVLQCSLYV